MVFCCDRVPDHPRIRGEHRGRSSKADIVAGSSPHTRGAPERLRPRVFGLGSSPHTRGAPEQPSTKSLWCRIIPAYAGSTPDAGDGGTARPDHPRIRGEHLPKPPAKTGSVGSSPHTRGAQHRRPKRGVLGRIIPAYAGSTPWLHVKPESSSDHPRIRGEHAATKDPGARIAGSSPHTRGARSATLYEVSVVADHPRIRGEHLGDVRPGDLVRGSSPHTRGAPLNRQKAQRYAAGSSPHTRGALGDPPCGVQAGRIIPAYAGSTDRPPVVEACERDHPRIRGEHGSGVFGFLFREGSSPHTRGALLVHIPSATPIFGSSPHTRGAPLRRRQARHRRRIIPAYAGSTWGRLCSCESRPDHPRIRGEHGSRSAPPPGPRGSSPHTRGARKARSPSSPWTGIIPAYAGSTGGHGVLAFRHADHPRIRGEHDVALARSDEPVGSSPHTRGALAWAGRTAAWMGIIPAYAGSTGPVALGRVGEEDHPRIRGEHGRVLGDVRPRHGSSPHTRGAQPSASP